MPAAALVARDISRSGYGVIGLNIGPEKRIPLPEPAGRSGGGHVTKYSNVLLRNRISRNRNLRVCNARTLGLAFQLLSLAHGSSMAAAQIRYRSRLSIPRLVNMATSSVTCFYQPAERDPSVADNVVLLLTVTLPAIKFTPVA